MTRTDAVSPSWSADGRRIVFVMGSSIWRVNGDGLRLTRISRRNIVDPESPALSPDETRVVFAARTSGQNFDIYIIRTKGSALRRLTKSPGADEHPSWSPNSKRIAFTHSALADSRPSAAELWTMNVDGSHQRRIGFGSAPDWAPDGRRIAFTRGADLWVANADGSEALRVIAGPGMAGDPAWSPDGRWIVFWSDRASDEATKGDLYLTTTNGEIVERLTHEPSSGTLRRAGNLWAGAPAEPWSPGLVNQ